MKIGLIADIHADLDKLLRVLDLLKHQHEVSRILCAGDLTGYGKQPNAVIDRMRALEIPTVKGNHDSPSAELSDENAAYLRQLPLDWRGEFHGQRVYMCHGIPGVPFIGITRQRFSDDQLVKMFMELDADVMITAHTHHPLVIDLPSGGKIVNPGAVYLNRYAVLSFPGPGVELHRSSAV